MKNDTMQLELNKQINAEVYSAYLYLSMAAYFDGVNLVGFAHWMKVQAQEEMEHAMKIYKYIYDRRWQVKFTAIATPKDSWESPLAAMEAAFAHEQTITAKINNLMDIAVSTKDYASQSLLKWFVDEQVEEESNADAIIQKIKAIHKNPGLILRLDAELGRRQAAE